MLGRVREDDQAHTHAHLLAVIHHPLDGDLRGVELRAARCDLAHGGLRDELTKPVVGAAEHRVREVRDAEPLRPADETERVAAHSDAVHIREDGRPLDGRHQQAAHEVYAEVGDADRACPLELALDVLERAPLLAQPRALRREAARRERGRPMQHEEIDVRQAELLKDRLARGVDDHLEAARAAIEALPPPPTNRRVDLRRQEVCVARHVLERRADGRRELGIDLGRLEVAVAHRKALLDHLAE